MKTKTTLRWNVEPSTTPLYKRKCNKCKKTTLYYCSDKFRINGQKKTLDVWLIYKCENCDNTSNIAIFSRVNPKTLDKEEYAKFMANDVATAWKYAFDHQVISSNKIEADFSNIEYNVMGDLLSLEEIVQREEELIEFEIGLQYNLDLKLPYIIRKNLKISLSEMEEMLSAGVISVLPLGPVKKCKLKDGIKVIVDRHKLQTYLSKKSDNNQIVSDKSNDNEE